MANPDAPILLLDVFDIEYITEIMEGFRIANPSCQHPEDTDLYQKMQKFLQDPKVIEFLEIYEEEMYGNLEELYEEIWDD